MCVLLHVQLLRVLCCLAAVSKAFSCLSNPDNRAAYDRYGDQEGAGISGQRRGPSAQGFGGDGFDAEEIFNMFFGNGFGGRCDLACLIFPNRIRQQRDKKKKKRISSQILCKLTATHLLHQHAVCLRWSCTLSHLPPAWVWGAEIQSKH